MKIISYKTRSRSQPVKRSSKFSFSWPRLSKLSYRSLVNWLVRLTAAGVVLAALLFLYYAKDLPEPGKLISRNVPESTKIYSRDGQLIYEVHGEIKRTLVNLDQISPYVKQATVAIEDKDFYKHGGISPRGILRAVITDILSGKKSQGGSTITQQLVKNAILTNDKTFDRKIRELILAISIDARFSKDDILRLYLNEIPYGRNSYGIESAAQSYFGKSAKDLTLAESAYLAALPQATTYYNPLGPNRGALDNRKNTILSLMREQGYISAEEEKKAKEEKVEFQKTKTAITAPHFVFMVQEYLAKKYGEKTLQEGGFKVYTTLDLRLQKIAEEAVKTGVEKNSKKYNSNNGALVAIDPKTGQILALVGSKDYFADSYPEGCVSGNTCSFEPNFNAADTELQPGSSFKPYVYVTAFKKEFGYAPASMLMDVITNFGKYGNEDYVPKNYNFAENGPLPMRKALAGSLNVPAVKTLALVGVNNATQTARDLGITSPLQDCGLSLVLGGCTVKLVDHVAAYSALANGGIKNEKTPILKIEDKNGKTLEEFSANPKPVLDPQAVYELVSIMTDNSARSFVFGPNSPLILPDRPVAAKTGTTNNWADGWTLGFTPSLAAGVWTGNNCGKKCPMKTGADGVLTAAPIWNQFMREALKDTPVEQFAEPDGIQHVNVDAVSGKLPTENTPSTVNEVFASYSVPTTYDDVHITIPYDLATGNPADSLTPPDRIFNKPFTILHSEKRDNPNWENPVVAWALAHGYVYPESNVTPPTGNPGDNPQINILEPEDNSTVSSLPFYVKVSASSAVGIARVDMSVDGQFVKSVTPSPFDFEITKKYSDGSHTFAFKAVDQQGKTSETSLNLIFSLTSPITILQPSEGERVSFPLSIMAETANPYQPLNFYYIGSKGGAKLLGQASNVTNLNGKYQHSLDFTGPLPAGDYSIYAETSTGVKTQKIKITVP